MKRNVRPVFRTGLTPVRAVGRFLYTKIAVQIYRVFFFSHRNVGRVYLPAKNRLIYLLSNRYAIHFTIVAIVAIVSTVNFSGSEVRAENFGERSIMYAMVTQDDSYVVEEVWAEEIREPEPSNYLGQGVIDTEARFVDEGYVNEMPVATIGGGAFMAPTISESDESVAPRTEVEGYLVQSGDTASGIAEKFGISTSTLLWANDLSAWSYIRPGEELNIPPVSGVLHTVTSGDTLNKIANSYEADTAKIIAFNKLGDVDDLVVGETIIIPEGVKKTAVPSVTRTYTSTPSSSTSGSTSYSGTYTGGTSGWVWPSPWRVITQYYGWNHGGLDIDCDYGVPNLAANDGVVTHAGWGTGYGLYVEIDHGGGIVTRYGHFSSLAVSAGQYVSSGQSLGMCGTTGRSTGTHLHFEVRVNGRTKNPLEYIR